MSELTITKEELQQYGPYADDMRRVALFSVANDFEAHGCPMPPHCDSLVAQSWCHEITRKIGVSYVAHIPYATDEYGEIARTWSPIYIPFEEFYAKVGEFVGWHLERLSFKPSNVVIVSGHGGNRQLPERTDDLAKRLGVPVMCLEAGVSEALVYPEFEALDAVYEIIAQGGEHAYILEYSLMAHLGHLDNAKLEMLNSVAEKDPLDALRRWPAIAGLGGYLEFGGPEYDSLRANEGFRTALADFKKRRKILADPELGRRANALVVNYLCERIQER